MPQDRVGPVALGIDARGRTYRWTVRRIGGATLRTDVSNRAILPVTVRDKRAGLDLLGALIEESRGQGGIVVYSSHDTLPVADAAKLTLSALAA